MSKVEKNLKISFEGEAKAYLRLLSFAEKAKEGGYQQIAQLFRAVAEAEKIHALNHLNLLGITKTTEENLKYSFEREVYANEVAYPQMIKEAEEEGDRKASLSFTRARDVEEGHADLYKKALQHLMEEKEVVYYVCGICGYISDNILPDECPICRAKKEMFKKVE